MVTDFFFLVIRRPPRSTLFPYTTLFRSQELLDLPEQRIGVAEVGKVVLSGQLDELGTGDVLGEISRVVDARDRKSTRLNSSHPSISYAVFCLKKKKRNKTCIRIVL